MGTEPSFDYVQLDIENLDEEVLPGRLASFLGLHSDADSCKVRLARNKTSGLCVGHGQVTVQRHLVEKLMVFNGVKFLGRPLVIRYSDARDGVKTIATLTKSPLKKNIKSGMLSPDKMQQNKTTNMDSRTKSKQVDPAIHPTKDAVVSPVDGSGDHEKHQQKSSLGNQHNGCRPKEMDHNRNERARVSEELEHNVLKLEKTENELMDLAKLKIVPVAVKKEKKDGEVCGGAVTKTNLTDNDNRLKEHNIAVEQSLNGSGNKNGSDNKADTSPIKCEGAAGTMVDDVIVKNDDQPPVMTVEMPKKSGSDSDKNSTKVAKKTKSPVKSKKEANDKEAVENKNILDKTGKAKAASTVTPFTLVKHVRRHGNQQDATRTSPTEVPGLSSQSSQCRLIDTGANLNHGAFTSDVHQVITRAQSVGVQKIVLMALDVRSSQAALTLAESYPGYLYCVVGVHPHRASTWTDQTRDQLASLARHPACVAIGECGLDYNKDFSPRDRQMEAFQAQLSLAVELHKPLYVHERDAHATVTSLLRVHAELLPSILIHCFTGTRTHAHTYLGMGCYIGVTGFLQNARACADSLRTLITDHELPMDRFVLQTNSPYMSVCPRNAYPYVNSRSEPSVLPVIADMFSSLARCSRAKVAAAAYDNALKLLNLAE